MNQITSIDQVKEAIADIRSLKDGYVSNFFLDLDKHEEWVTTGLFFCEAHPCCHLFIKKEPTFSYCFYVACRYDAVVEALRSLNTGDQKPIIMDVVGIENDVNEATEQFKNAGFSTYKTLYRMLHVGTPKLETVNDPNIREATKTQIDSINQMLQGHFDAKSEQIPSKKQLADYCEKGFLLVYMKDELIAGFVLCEYSKQSFYWRYCYVDAAYRNQGIASKLYYSAVAKASTSKRQYLWVISTNENAIKRWEHLGFSRDRLNDYVLIRN